MVRAVGGVYFCRRKQAGRGGTTREEAGMWYRRRLGALAVAVALVSNGCFGSFNLTRKLYQWNDQISQDKWIKELIFIVLVWVPVYGLAGLGDAVLFNTIEFWSGENPIEMTADGRGVQTRRVVREDAEAVLKHILHPEKETLVIDQFQEGKPAAGLRITRRGDVAVATDTEGRTLFTAQMLPDGSLMVSDATGAPIAVYSDRDFDRLVASATR